MDKYSCETCSQPAIYHCLHLPEVSLVCSQHLHQHYQLPPPHRLEIIFQELTPKQIEPAYQAKLLLQQLAQVALCDNLKSMNRDVEEMLRKVQERQRDYREAIER